MKKSPEKVKINNSYESLKKKGIKIVLRVCKKGYFYAVIIQLCQAKKDRWR